jgi:hypothetical protein
VVEPPVDPDDWTEEQWREWLLLTELDPDTERRVYAPQLSSPTGVVLGAAMMGLHKGIYGDIEKPEIVVEIGAKGQDDGLKVELDPDDPAHSRVVIERPND